MKAIMVMFDSLNKHYLPNYGCDWTKLPNFKRLGDRTVTFDQFYVGSMPCMPARRELHAGRYNMLHRSWGPLEPFDDSMPEILKNNGVYTHLVSDHQHYWEDGGCTYHSRYSSWEISRGQEGDTWKGMVGEPHIPEHEYTSHEKGRLWRQDWVNRQYLVSEDNQPQAKTFKAGLEFIEKNYTEDQWFLQIETFDPHEPFFTQQHYKDLYPHQYDGRHFDWPPYDKVTQRDEIVGHARYQYAALLSMCDHYLGKVLDMMDNYNMWEDTMLIVNTDHGFFLGEKNWWAKSIMPLYNEIANTPFFIWDPRIGAKHKRCSVLAQTIDIAPTLLEYFGVEIPKDMQGQSLKKAIAHDERLRDTILFGYFGKFLNVTDGEYVYMRNAESDVPIYQYTLMPTHMRSMFKPSEFEGMELSAPFSFTKGCQLMKIKTEPRHLSGKYTFKENKLFNVKEDPCQENELTDRDIEERMMKLMIRLMDESDAPKEQYKRYNLI
ncbi:sulfatase [Vallitalea okinawensis]|uniref:sulfatase n=1 Tax=Vallitalea okinawensis TaxID=2078660 RepID=UPI000CFD5A70|nr:sulfatase [Vallitalea okinawensis]